MRRQFLIGSGTLAITGVGATYFGLWQMGSVEEYAASVAATWVTLSRDPAILKHAFNSQPVEVANLRPELASLIGLLGRRPNLVMRFGYGPTMPYSARRSVAAVLV